MKRDVTIKLLKGDLLDPPLPFINTATVTAKNATHKIVIITVVKDISVTREGKNLHVKKPAVRDVDHSRW